MFNKVKFNEYEQFFNQEHSQSFELLEGEGVVIVSAPHSVEQTRNNQIKYAEPQTGVLAKMLHDVLNCPVIYKTRNCGDDANFDENSSYKQALLEYIKNNNIAFLIDLHQLSPTRDVKINIGTGRLKNISKFEFINLALKVFSQRNIGLIQIDEPFDATYPFTISSYISSACNISCLQIEMNSGIVRVDTDDSQVEKVFDALVELVKSISEMIQGEQR